MEIFKFSFFVCLIQCCIVNSIIIIEETDTLEFQNEYDQLFNPDLDSDSDSDSLLKISSFNLPDLSEISRACPKKEFFHSMNPVHMKAVTKMKQLFMGTNSTTEFFKLARALKKNSAMNPKVWFYALTSYLTNDASKLMRKIRKISPWEAAPDDFFFSEVLEKAKGMSGKDSKCVHLNERFGADNGIDNALWYFREDILFNAHHWYYHLIYPWYDPKVRGDRTGELFYYFHQAMIARYNAERFSNGQPRVLAFDLRVGGVIEEGYNPHLTEENSKFNWTSRDPFTPFVDTRVNNSRAMNIDIHIENLILARNRISAAIDAGYLVAKNGTKIPLDTFDGIDYLTNVVQAKVFSVNNDFYGIYPNGLHNAVHVVISLSSDPQGKFKLPPGVMANDNGAARDPVFYRWHKYVTDILDRHKRKLKPYDVKEGDFPLLWEGVTLKSVKVISKSSGNRLTTFWRRRDLKLSHGLDYASTKEPVHLCVKHLDHKPFRYEFTITKKQAVMSPYATIRVFMAPRYTENGTPFKMDDQRSFFFALDSFSVPLMPGRNTIIRNSTESTLTIPWEGTYDELQKPWNYLTPNCGCGWPHHLLIPKGKATGLTFDLFVMVTNGDDDAVSSGDLPGNKEPCGEAHVYCGLWKQKYPDAKPMGYPFDRIPHSGKDSTLEEFADGIPNIKTAVVRIFHTDITVAA